LQKIQEELQEKISRLNAEVEAARKRVEGKGFWRSMVKAVMEFIIGDPVGAAIRDYNGFSHGLNHQ
jgi:hypothetical protein